MANKNLFRSAVGKLLRRTDARNRAGAPAYAYSDEHALAQLAATGCLNGTFYADAGDQLDRVLALCAQVPPEFIAKVALYSRQQGYMKDMPALLCAVLSLRDPQLLSAVFPRVIDNGRMLRSFVQIVRSGAVGRKSLGSGPKRLIQQWLAERGDAALFRASVGNHPSLADVIKLVHPKPATPTRAALYGYLIGRAHDAGALPELVQDYEAFKRDRRGPPPPVPFQMLTALDLETRHWVEIARHAGWQMTRMNLNTFQRHGVFDHPGMAELIATRLGDPEAVRRARAFPYQLLAAYANAGVDLPHVVRDALQDAMEVAIDNVPRIDGRVYVCPDVSGSMAGSVTGWRRGSTSAVRCIDVAGLLAAAVLRKNPGAAVLPFEHEVVALRLNPRDSVLTNTEKLAQIGGGGTDCSAPLARLNARRARGDLVIYVSDNESWIDAGRARGSEMMAQWNAFKRRNPAARLVCVDLQPYGTTQAHERDDILNVGGFSDRVFEVIAQFAAGGLDADHWLGQIEKVELTTTAHAAA